MTSYRNNNSNTYFLFRENLYTKYIDIPIEKVDINMFPDYRLRDIELADMVVFFDKNCDTSILKSRYGKRGILR